MVPSLFPHAQLCCVLLVPHPRGSALCLLASTAPHPICFSASLPPSLLPCFSAMAPSQWFSPPFRPLVRFSLITRLPLFSCLPGTASFPLPVQFPGFSTDLKAPFQLPCLPLTPAGPPSLLHHGSSLWPFLSLRTPGPSCPPGLSPPPSPFTSGLCSLVSCLCSALPSLLLGPLLVSIPPLSLFSFLLAADRVGVVAGCGPDFTCRPGWSQPVSLTLTLPGERESQSPHVVRPADWS